MVKTRLAAIILSALLITPGWAETTSPSLVVTPPQPKWSELTVQQKIILAPLADDWDSLEYFRQKTWLDIVTRFATMTPEEQRRIQVQMQEWGKLTPAQRQLARENFKTANQLPAKKKQELRQKWEEYSNLPEDEKEKLKQQAASAPKPGRPAVIPAPPQPAQPQPAPATLTAPAPIPLPLPPPPPPVEEAAPAATETTSQP